MLKKVVEVRRPPGMHWVGDGFPVRSMFHYGEPPELLSPFLLLDYAAPRRFEPSDRPRGVGEHPHRGFETVTIAYQGEIEHRDSAGHAGRIGPGDVQWMSAASGVVHEEMHGREFTRKGGTLEMVQLWVNLPARFKMSAPRYQDLVASSIPSVGGARVIAGELDGVRGPAKTYTPVELWDVAIPAGRTFEAALPEGHGGAVLALHGGATVAGVDVPEAGLGFLDRRGDRVSIEAARDARVLLLAGAPIEEPVVGYGPFVMTSEEEIRQAIADYQAGRLGKLAPV